LSPGSVASGMLRRLDNMHTDNVTLKLKLQHFLQLVVLALLTTPAAASLSPHACQPALPHTHVPAWVARGCVVSSNSGEDKTMRRLQQELPSVHNWDTGTGTGYGWENGQQATGQHAPQHLAENSITGAHFGHSTFSVHVSSLIAKAHVCAAGHSQGTHPTQQGQQAAGRRRAHRGSAFQSLAHEASSRDLAVSSTPGHFTLPAPSNRKHPIFQGFGHLSGSRRGVLDSSAAHAPAYFVGDAGRVGDKGYGQQPPTPRVAALYGHDDGDYDVHGDTWENNAGRDRAAYVALAGVGGL